MPINPILVFARSTWTRIVRIDNRSLEKWSADHAFRLLPGHHSLDVGCTYWGPLYCSGLASYSMDSSVTTINNLHLIAGQKYMIKGETRSESACDVIGQKCSIKVENMDTGKVIQNVEVTY